MPLYETGPTAHVSLGRTEATRPMNARWVEGRNRSRVSITRVGVMFERWVLMID